MAGIPNVFSANTRIKSAEVNANFTAVWPTPTTAWTPSITGTGTAGVASYTTGPFGRYGVIGDWVMATVFAAWNGHTGTGNLRCSIPLMSANVDAGWAVIISGYSNIDMTAGSTQLTGAVAANGTVINFRGTRNNNTDQGVALPTAVAASLQLLMFYEKAA